jgi:glycosyltransferase 2 family protein
MSLFGMQASRANLYLGFKIGISILCFFVIWKWVDLSYLAKMLKGIALLPFLIAILFNLIHKTLNAYKIGLLFPSPRPPLMDLIAVNFIAVFFRAFLPGGVGGELARWSYLGQESGSKSRAMAVILLDRITGLWAQIFLALLALLAWLWMSKSSQAIWIAGPVALTLLLGSLWAGLWGYRSLATGLDHLRAWYRRKRRLPIELNENIGQALSDLLASRSRFWQIVSLSLISQILVVATFLLIDRSIEGKIEWIQAPLLLFCYSIVLLLPVTVGTWGLSEGTLGLLYYYAGAGGSMGVVISLALRLMDLPAVFLGWIFFLRHRNRSSPT